MTPQMRAILEEAVPHMIAIHLDVFADQIGGLLDGRITPLAMYDVLHDARHAAMGVHLFARGTGSRSDTLDNAGFQAHTALSLLHGALSLIAQERETQRMVEDLAREGVN